MGGSCNATQPEWGDKLFVLNRLKSWKSQATVRVCVADNRDHLFLFQNNKEFMMITKYQENFDIAFIDAASQPIELEANGGMGRYLEVQEQYENLRHLPSKAIGRNDYDTVIDSTPRNRCGF